ncbi:MAG: hypothetical protein RMJ44_09545, partial [Cytophagales bacterium]|nr:hypothetical protein [Cytophagales bacterium]
HTFFKNLNPEEYGFTPEEVKEALKNVRIIHYSGSDKPWYGYTDHHYYQEYFNYLRDIPPKIRNKLSSFTFLLEAERHNKELDYKAATLSLLKSVLYYPLFIETYGKLAYTLFKWVKTKAQT